MNTFVRNLITEWRKINLPFENASFIVAVSGGADSLSLALALNDLRKRKKLDLRFVIAHYNHDLRGVESKQDEEFVKKLADEHKFELALGTGKVSTKNNLEQNARNARYTFLAETAKKLNAKGVLTAHTLNDQAETFLLNLIRGSGLQGLGGMKVVRSLESERPTEDEKRRKGEKEKEEEQNQSAIALIRPLLSWATREMTEKFCRDEGVEFRYDSMNEDLAFKRVRIRKVLLPLLKDFNPKIIENLAKTAFYLQDDFGALEKIRELGLTGFEQLLDEEKPKSLKLDNLRNLFPSMQRSLLRDWLKVQRGNLRGLDSKHFEAIEKLISSQKSGKLVELPNNATVKKENGKLSFNQNKG